jgi:hypothetical protein
MDTIIKKEISFKIEFDEFLKRIKLNKDYQDIDQVRKIVKKANQIGRPKAMYKELFIDEIGEDYVVVEDEKFESKIMSVNLKEVHKVVIYLITCGTELEKWAEQKDGDMLENYWLSMAQEAVLEKARDYIKKEINEKYLPGSTSIMNPGSLIDWSITEQKKLFSLLGDPEKEIGVKLTESSLMLPAKSVSGLIYPTEKDFENCQVCPRENCPSRSAPYEPELIKKRYS